MSDFVARLLPWLPASLQSEHLAEAASHFNRFSERLSSCRSIEEERSLVLAYLELTIESLSQSDIIQPDDQQVLLYDHISFLTYLRLVDHWALTGKECSLPDMTRFIGILLHSRQPKNRVLGSFAAQFFIPQADLLLANTIAKLLDCSGSEDLIVAFKLVDDHVSGTSAPLFTQGCLRAARSKHPMVRSRAWLAARRLVEFDEAFSKQWIVIWDTQTGQEQEPCVIQSILSFSMVASSLPEWIDRIRIYSKWLQTRIQWNGDAVAILITILRLESGLEPFRQQDIPSLIRWVNKCQKCVTQDGPKDALLLEIFKKISAVDNLSLEDLDDILPIPMAYLKVEKVREALLLLECLAKSCPKAVLPYQSELIRLIEGDDEGLRLKAFSILMHTANPSNYEAILEHSLTTLKDPSTSVETGKRIMRFAFRLYDRFELNRTAVGRCFCQVLDLVSVEYGEGDADEIANLLIQEHGKSVLASDWSFLRERDVLKNWFTNLILAWVLGHLKCKTVKPYIVRTYQSGRDDHVLARILQISIFKLQKGTISLEDEAFKEDTTFLSLLRNPDLSESLLRVTSMLEAFRICTQFEENRGKTFGEFSASIDENFAEFFNADLLKKDPEHHTGQASPESPTVSPFQTIEDFPQFPTSTDNIQITSNLFKGLI